MKLSIDSNGWTLTIKEDISTLSQEQLHEVARLCNKHYVVIFRNHLAHLGLLAGLAGLAGLSGLVIGGSDQFLTWLWNSLIRG